ncbi:MAG: cation transporter [Bacteroidetes bacterium]|nr:cation transporter [Bacteroidota bacterium]
MKSIIQIEGMTCGHCAAYVTKLINNLLSADNFKVNLEANNVEIADADSQTVENIKTAINEDGIYKAI